jgi:tRNA (guanine37-N1)-methyltransferase
LQLDVFTLVPHAFAWLTEQRPVATVLGGELDLRLFSYRDTTPLRNGQVDDEPYGGGAGMVLRVDVVAAALDAAYGGSPGRRVVALTPKGRRLDQRVVEELAAEPRLALLSARFEGFDERVVEHLATDAVSIGPYVLSNGDLPAMVRLEYPHYTRPAEFRGWEVPHVLLSGDHARIDAWRREHVR